MLIEDVRVLSPASRAGLRRGDRLLACDGRPIEDWLDFSLWATGVTTRLTIGRLDRLERALTLRRRRPGQDWGVLLAGSAPVRCPHSCVFCFVDQNPSGLRPELYVKDDDVRHSFFRGTFVSLNEEQASEAIRRRLSPLNVSVHTTDPELRGRLFGHSRGPLPILPGLGRLSEAGLEVDAQIVLIPGWNDGGSMTGTLEDLLELATSVRSAGVVPVGLTRHGRQRAGGAGAIRRPNREEAGAAIDAVGAVQAAAFDRTGTRWAYAADELYLLADREIPPEQHYIGCPQRANGIGLLAAAAAGVRERSRGGWSGTGSLFTGALAYPFLKEMMSGTRYRAVEVRNTLFGDVVGVAGLLSGRDIIDRAAELRDLVEPIYLPSVMFNHEGLTLDGLTAADIGNAAGRQVRVRTGLTDLP